MNNTTNLVTNYLETLHQTTLRTIVTDALGKLLDLEKGIFDFIDEAKKIHSVGGKLIFIGNGASSSMASHFALDYTKNGKIRSTAINDGPMLTALANDIGADAIFSEQLRYYGHSKDGLVAISSSGSSPNIITAVESARSLDMKIFTFSGFRSDNPLRASGQLNFWVHAQEYGFVEIAHTALLHAILDLSQGWGTSCDQNPAVLKSVPTHV